MSCGHLGYMLLGHVIIVRRGEIHGILLGVTDFHNLNILYDISNHFNTSNSIYSDFTGFLQIFREPLEP